MTGHAPSLQAMRFTQNREVDRRVTPITFFGP